mmetsp:Transcript_7229/g.11831  ORF Transcript_7229/g.11831 Transcript_7229/m.11831 type:complete len:267 (-) Transcript_7229:568-1368(-)
MFIHSGNNRTHNNSKCTIISSRLVHLGRVQQHDPILSSNTPIVVFSTSINIIKWLLLHQRRQPMTDGNLLNNLHNHQVLIDLGSVQSKQWCKLILIGCHLTMTSLKWDTQPPALILNLLHTRQGRRRQRRRGHVMITHLLTAGSILPNNRTSSHLQIWTTVVLITWDQEEFLFETNVGDDILITNVQSKVLEETLAVFGEGGIGTQEGCLFIECGTVIGDKGTGNKDGIPPQEDGRGGIKGQISSGGMSRTETSIGIGRSIGLSLG